MASIYCDESGNSGQALIDLEQPYFVLASNDYSQAEAEDLLRHLHSDQAKEAKFKVLKKSSSGKKRLINFFTDPRLNETRVIVSFFHKRFMIVSKMVDLIVETLFHDKGYDLYENGQNIAMANMLYYCMPEFCGAENTDELLKSFVTLMNDRSSEAAATFFEAGAKMLDSCTRPEFKEDLRLITDKQLLEHWYPHIGKIPLEPAVPALFEHIAIWGKRKSERFDVIHDSSKPVLATQQDFEAMMAQGEELSKDTGYDRRKFLFPLRCTSLKQGDSIQHPQIQVADVCSGAINHYLKCTESNEFDELATIIKDTGCLQWIVNGVLPTQNITPEQLGTGSNAGSNHIDFIVDYLRKNSPKNKL